MSLNSSHHQHWPLMLLWKQMLSSGWKHVSVMRWLIIAHCLLLMRFSIFRVVYTAWFLLLSVSESSNEGFALCGRVPCAHLSLYTSAQLERSHLSLRCHLRKSGINSSSLKIRHMSWYSSGCLLPPGVLPFLYSRHVYHECITWFYFWTCLIIVEMW